VNYEKEKRANQFLKETKDIVVVRADKGSTTVIMDGDSANTGSTYKKLDRDPIAAIQKKNNTLVKKLHETNGIEPCFKEKLTAYNSVVPRIYGLPKIHKQQSNIYYFSMSCKSTLDLGFA
jgi:hypothetical protein